MAHIDMLPDITFRPFSVIYGCLISGSVNEEFDAQFPDHFPFYH